MRYSQAGSGSSVFSKLWLHNLLRFDKRLTSRVTGAACCQPQCRTGRVNSRLGEFAPAIGLTEPSDKVPATSQIKLTSRQRLGQSQSRRLLVLNRNKRRRSGIEECIKATHGRRIVGFVVECRKHSFPVCIEYDAPKVEYRSTLSKW